MKGLSIVLVSSLNVRTKFPELTDADSDGAESGEMTPEDGADVMKEILDWRTSRPLVLHGLENGPPLSLEP